MIKMLTIISLAAAALAGLVLASALGLVSFIHLGAPDYEDAAEILESPSAVAKFKEQQGDVVPSSEGKTPPLIRQAELLAGIFTPRPAVGTARITPGPGGVKSPPPPPRSTAKFELVGTVHSPSNPSESFAYIRLADNTYQWIELGGTVGHSVVREIKDRSIIYFDGQSNVEMTVAEIPDTASLLEAGGARPTATASEPSAPAAISGADRPVALPSLPDRATATTYQPVSPQMSEQDEEALGELVDRLRKADVNMAPQDRAAMVERLIAEFKASRVSDEESERLGDLGKELDGAKEKSTIERRREFMRRLSPSRSSDR